MNDVIQVGDEREESDERSNDKLNEREDIRQNKASHTEAYKSLNKAASE